MFLYAQLLQNLTETKKDQVCVKSHNRDKLA